MALVVEELISVLKKSIKRRLEMILEDKTIEINRGDRKTIVLKNK